MIKLVAFDWNGTIFADTYAILDSINEVLKSLNLKPVSLTTFQKHFDVPVTKAYLGLGIPQEVIAQQSSKIIKFHTYYEKRAEKVRTRAYAKSVLEWLLKNKIKSIIFSNHIDEPVKKQLRRLKIEKYFAAVLTNTALDASLKGRNKQQKLKEYLKKNNIIPKEVLIIGDTIEEIEIGNQLGAVTVALTHGNCSITRLKVVKPNYLVYSLKGIVNIIKSLNRK